MILIFPFQSCEVIFEKNISKDSLNLIIPVNNQVSTTNQIHFKWDKVKGASHYHLQIVKPSFSQIDFFILDSLIDVTQYFYVLEPGDYQFQIRAENSAYETAWVGPYNLTVDSVSDLSQQVVGLIAPANYVYTNNSILTYSWQAVYSAEYYEFQLRTGADFNSSSTTLHVANSIYATSYSNPTGLLDNEGIYAWGIKAINQTSSSDFSSRTIYIDKTNPNSPSAVSPNHNTNFADTVVLKWTLGTDPGTVNSPVTSYIQIGADTLFNTILSNYNTTADSLQLVFTNSGTYWWRVYAQDQAGNISPFFSQHRKFIIP